MRQMQSLLHPLFTADITGRPWHLRGTPDPGEVGTTDQWKPALRREVGALRWMAGPRVSLGSVSVMKNSHLLSGPQFSHLWDRGEGRPTWSLRMFSVPAAQRLSVHSFVHSFPRSITVHPLGIHWEYIPGSILANQAAETFPQSCGLWFSESSLLRSA